VLCRNQFELDEKGREVLHKKGFDLVYGKK
jgi:hypothetical protein